MSKPRYMKRDSYIGPRSVRFIPIKDGDVVELADTGPNTTSFYATRPRHILLGFKPAAAPRSGRAEGWIVVLVDEDAHKESKPRKHQRNPAGLRAIG